MKKKRKLIKSIVVIFVVLLLQIAASVPQTVLSLWPTVTGRSFDLEAALSSLTNSSVTFSQITNVLYGLLCLIVFGRWYRNVFVLPFRQNAPSDYPKGFSLHTIISIVFLALGLQYTTQLIVSITATLRPDWLAAYNALMESAGYADASALLIAYSVLMAPIAEELIFRGLIFRYSRYALPFWAANLYQAMLFGLIHGNFIQGIYAFALGLFLGFVVHRGRGIKYSIPVHILFNAIGLFYSGLIELTLALNYAVAITCGVALTAFALWLFYTDFTPEKENV